MEEVWKDVIHKGIGYTGYRVSNLGRVYSLWVRKGLGQGIGGIRVLGNVPTMLAPISQSNGYLTVNLFKDGKNKTVAIHAIVLEAFVGPRPEGMVCCHGPNGKSDNSVSNVSYGTHSKNNGEDKDRDGRKAAGERNAQAKLTEEGVQEIKKLLACGVQGRVIARQRGISESQVSRIKKGESWRCIA